MQLRDYQREAIDSLYHYFGKNSGNPLLILPTAAGKSVILGQFIKEVVQQWPNQRVLMLTHVKELIEQNYSKLKTLWPEAPAGIYSASLKRRDVFEPIIYAGIQSVFKKAMHLGRFDLIVIDECHLVNVKSSGMYRKFISDSLVINPHLKVIGLTATAFRTGTGDITHGDDALFDNVAYEVTILDLLNQSYLSPLISKRMAAEFDTSGLNIRQGEFVQKEVEQLVDKEDVTKAALDEVMQYGRDRRSWLLFCAGIQHAEHVRDALLSRGIAAACLTGKTRENEREQIIDGFKSGYIKALTNCDVLTTGFDAPATDLLVFLRPTHSPGLYVQMMGRGMRKSDETDKKNCLVLDFAGNVIRHGPVDQVKAWIPEKRKKREENPTKTCPIEDCKTIVAVQTRTCPVCGFEFPFDENDKHEKTATTAAILSTDIDISQHLETIDITDVFYFKHQKKGAVPTMRVNYMSGLFMVASEWICFEHKGFAKTKAVNWWRGRYKYDTPYIPQDVDEALELSSNVLKKPVSITVNTKGKYKEIINYEFEQERATAIA